MAEKKALATLRKHHHVRSAANGTDMFGQCREKGFTLNDRAQRRVTGAGQNRRVKSRLWREAQADNRYSGAPRGGKPPAQRLHGAVCLPGGVAALPPQFRQRRVADDKARVKAQAGRAKSERCGDVGKKTFRRGTGHSGQKLNAEFKPRGLDRKSVV